MSVFTPREAAAIALSLAKKKQYTPRCFTNLHKMLLLIVWVPFFPTIVIY